MAKIVFDEGRYVVTQFAHGAIGVECGKFPNGWEGQQARTRLEEWINTALVPATLEQREKVEFLEKTVDGMTESIGKFVALRKDDNATIAQLLEENEQLRERVSVYVEKAQLSEKRVYFLEKCLNRIRYICALDVVADGTHRSRNETYRSVISSIAKWLVSDWQHIYEDMDDIPF